MRDQVFLFGVHNHQPVGNFTSVFEKAFRDCYRPFLSAMAKHPSLKFTLHCSGPLWEYMEEKEKETWRIIKDLVNRGQVELLGGGFYEPILSLIPEEDRAGQIRLMSAFLEENFGTKPRGLWLAERVWEPHLAKSLALAGVEYTLLDEEHFRYAGVKNIHGYYITEDEGYPLKLFPIDKKLRYMIPFQSLEEVKKHFREIGEKGGAAILADDGEKFGLWPGTKKWVYEEGWLRNFLSFLEGEGIQTATYSEFLDTNPPVGRAYLPPASYEEMMEWVLDPEEHAVFTALKKGSPENARRFLRGGFFREFLLKYPESNHLHKRMILVSREVQKSGSEEARRELYKAQGNDPYWHGVFGGLYLPHLREASYFHLLKAEEKAGCRTGPQILDYDADGREEVLYRGEKFNILVKPSSGGAVIELDYKPLARNLTDVLSRRPESYHVLKAEGAHEEGRSIHELAKKIPPNAGRALKYDRHSRFSLIDHLFPPQTGREDFEEGRYEELGDFIDGEYSFNLQENNLILEKTGSLRLEEGKVSLRLRKEIRPEPSRLVLEYEVENLSGQEIAALFGSEWNLSLFPDEIEAGGEEILLLGRRLVFKPLGAQDIWLVPIETLSQSEEGYDIIHQGLCLLPCWKLILPGGKKTHFAIIIEEQYGP